MFPLITLISNSSIIKDKFFILHAIYVIIYLILALSLLLYTYLIITLKINAISREKDTKPGKELDYILVRANSWTGKTVYIELWVRI